MGMLAMTSPSFPPVQSVTWQKMTGSSFMVISLVDLKVTEMDIDRSTDVSMPFWGAIVNKLSASGSDGSTFSNEKLK